ncbi:hypothetical protein BDW59DRAFT_154944 [Aspergillus cavernicola]|uniref:Uncharacterized protein n=1 Tax=Aspergillus cavernicola TaxID=176166 RepID=A0ABR4HCT3_9EURO
MEKSSEEIWRRSGGIGRRKQSLVKRKEWVCAGESRESRQEDWMAGEKSTIRSEQEYKCESCIATSDDSRMPQSQKSMVQEEEEIRNSRETVI